MYPYLVFSEEGVRTALKQEYQSDSPIITGSFLRTIAKGELDGQATGEFQFLTEDHKKYRITVIGTCDTDPIYGSFSFNWQKITSIKQI